MPKPSGTPFALAGARDGYRLFASEFSYDKVRSDFEDVRLDYLSKIHKTFADVQGQMLGIPVATVVVASQLKPAKDCGGEFWIDAAVLAGAWVFVVLLWLALENQRLTLGVIEAEVSRQRSEVLADYATASRPCARASGAASDGRGPSSSPSPSSASWAGR